MQPQKAGELAADVYRVLCDRFNPIHQWAMASPVRDAFIAAVSEFGDDGEGDEASDEEETVDVGCATRLSRRQTATLFDDIPRG